MGAIRPLHLATQEGVFLLKEAPQNALCTYALHQNINRARDTLFEKDLRKHCLKNHRLSSLEENLAKGQPLRSSKQHKDPA